MSRMQGTAQTGATVDSLLLVRDFATKMVSDDTAIQTWTTGMAGSAAGMLDIGAGLAADSTAIAALLLAANSQPMSTEFGTGTSDAANYASRITNDTTGLRKTEILIDIAGLASEATDNDVIGDGTDANAHIGRILLADSGTIIGGNVLCLEIPATGEIDIDLYADSSATIAAGADGTGDTALLQVGANWSAGLRKALTGVPAADDYLYLTVGTSSTPTAGTYTTGIFLITFYGV